MFFTGAVSDTLTFTGIPFNYNPADGNLLLTVELVSPNPLGTFLLAGCSTQTNRVANNKGSTDPIASNPNCSSTTGYGLATEFTVTPVAVATPEPSGFVLLSTGVLGVVQALRRRLT